MKRGIYLLLIVLLGYSCSCSRPIQSYSPEKDRPNILFVITDDQSWEHVGSYGDQAVRTPASDQLAKEGVLFENAYTACPSCSPSRASILTGQDAFRIEEGGVLTGFIRDKFALFPKILAENGYIVGSTGKRYWPRTKNVAGAVDEPIGTVFDKRRLDSAPIGISRNNYSANFDDFLDQVPDNQPFFFWVGAGEPHLKYQKDRGVEIGIDTARIRIPKFLPDVPVVRLELADYMSEIEWADEALGRMIKSLESRALKENTLIVMTSDNGMPFPRAKATLYDHGVRMPLIMSWGKRITENRLVADPVSLIDMAPTFLDLAGIPIPEQMTGRSILNLMFSNRSGHIDDEREFVVTTFEKHTLCRPDSMGYPRRALHTEEWTYIINYEPDLFPNGNMDIFIPGWDNFGDTDPSRIKTYFKDHMEDPDFELLWELGFGKVTKEQLFNKISDPDMINNLAYNKDFKSIKDDLKLKLETYLIEKNDPRSRGKSPWDNYNLDK